MECFGGVDRILTRHCIDDKECVIRSDSIGDAPNFIHEVGINRQASGGVDDEYVFSNAACFSETTCCSCYRVTWFRKDWHIDLLTQCAQLLYCSWPLKVGPHQQRMTTLRFKPTCELCRTGGFTRTLQTRHEHNSGRLTCVRNFEGLAAQHCRELLAHNFHYLLAGVERL